MYEFYAKASMITKTSPATNVAARNLLVERLAVYTPAKAVPAFTFFSLAFLLFTGWSLFTF
jgi:hypothetical protein